MTDPRHVYGDVENKTDLNDIFQAIRRVAKEEFATTVRAINRRARQIGTEADYDETSGE